MKREVAIGSRVVEELDDSVSVHYADLVSAADNAT